MKLNFLGTPRSSFLDKLIRANMAIPVLAGLMLLTPQTCVTQVQAASAGKTGLPVPRFVSLKSKRVNMRVGPGQQFKVAWLYLKKGLPMEIIQEYENWRKVRDPEGNEGWILHSLLSGKRTAIFNPGEKDKTAGRVRMLSKSSKNATLLANVEPGVIGDVKACEENWCRISVKNVDGYVEKKVLWGVYPDELIEN